MRESLISTEMLMRQKSWGELFTGRIARPNTSIASLSA
jgi:hypothetical protein